jgi:hypothetical protein
MGFTVTLDDIDALLRGEMKRSGESFKQVVNRILRLGLNLARRTQQERGGKSVPLPALRRRSYSR